MNNLFKSNPLFFVFLVPVIVDVVGTVAGQTREYWTSGYQVINEAAPVYPLLQIHPLLFILVVLTLWLSFTYFLTKKLKIPYNLWAALALFAGHSYNSIYWLRLTQKNLGILQGDKTLSLIPMVLYILLIGFIASKGISKYFSKK